MFSACQTAMTEGKRLPDEFLGFPSGFLQAGVPGVVGSFWPVEDLSTSLLMNKFYELHLGDSSDTSKSKMHRSPIANEKWVVVGQKTMLFSLICMANICICMKKNILEN